MKRRKYVLTAVMFLIAALVICFTLPQLAEPRFQVENKIRSLLHRYDLTSRADAYEIRQIMTQDPSTSRTLMWQSQDEDNRALAEIRKKGRRQAKLSRPRLPSLLITESRVISIRPW
ncbi:MAG: hypothetical protein ACLVLA_01235 [Acidaminococcus intestini]